MVPAHAPLPRTTRMKPGCDAAATGRTAEASSAWLRLPGADTNSGIPDLVYDNHQFIRTSRKDARKEGLPTLTGPISRQGILMHPSIERPIAAGQSRSSSTLRAPAPAPTRPRTQCRRSGPDQVPGCRFDHGGTRPIAEPEPSSRAERSLVLIRRNTEASRRSNPIGDETPAQGRTGKPFPVTDVTRPRGNTPVRRREAGLFLPHGRGVARPFLGPGRTPEEFPDGYSVFPRKTFSGWSEETPWVPSPPSFPTTGPPARGGPNVSVNAE